MFAVVEIGGAQFKVEPNQEIFVNRLDANEGDKVSFDKVLMVNDGGAVRIGTPTVSSTVNATVVEHLKGDKVIVFKKKRRKGYRVKNGHRQHLTKIKVDSIL